MAFASYNYLITRYDKKKVDEVSQFTEYDPLIQDYVSVTDQTKLIERANQALSDAAFQLRYILSCCYGDLTELDQAILDGKTFPMLEHYNAQLAYYILKNQSSDCEECTKCKDEFENICGCNLICSTDGTTCLTKEDCFIVEEKKECIPSMCEQCCEAECVCCQPDEDASMT